MQPVFVLVHSPSVGPLTWAPVATQLEARGWRSVVPSLLDVADAGPPFWPRVVDDVTAVVSGLSPHQPVVLVAHSNAGLFMPLLASNVSRPVLGCLFVDAALPGAVGINSCRTGRIAATPPNQGERGSPAAVDGLVGRGGRRADVPGPPDPGRGVGRATAAAVGVLRAVGAGACRLGRPSLWLPRIRTSVRRTGRRSGRPRLAGGGDIRAAPPSDRGAGCCRRTANHVCATLRDGGALATASVNCRSASGDRALKGTRFTDTAQSFLAAGRFMTGFGHCNQLVEVVLGISRRVGRTMPAS